VNGPVRTQAQLLEKFLMGYSTSASIKSIGPQYPVDIMHPTPEKASFLRTT
jgi:hypothetical protein